MQERPLISVIIPTVGRDLLTRAVDSALTQEIPGGIVEVIVVNDSGHELSTDSAILNDRRVSIIATNKRRQSVARNVGAAVATGAFLLFLDDDDYLAPTALASLLEIMNSHPHYAVVYGGVAFVNDAEEQLGVLNLGVTGNCASHMLAGTLISLGSALIRTDAFFEIGGINPIMTVSEDVELMQRLAMMQDFGNSSSVVLRALRNKGWATSQDYGPAVAFLRLSREQVLDQNDSFARLEQSARGPYWRGRIFKAYLSSILWNLKAGRILIIVSRLVGATLSIVVARTAIFHRDFWRAIMDTQVPATVDRVLLENDFQQTN